jgi:hypothetical protein
MYWIIAVDASIHLQIQLWCGEVAETTRVGQVVQVGAKLDIATKTSHSKHTCMITMGDPRAFLTTLALKGHAGGKPEQGRRSYYMITHKWWHEMRRDATVGLPWGHDSADDEIPIETQYLP